MMNPPSLLLLGGASRSQGVRCAAQARAAGLRVVLTDSEDNLLAAPEITDLADVTAVLDYQDPEACTDWARRRASSLGLVGVFGFREYSVISVAAVAEALCLPGNPSDAVRRVRDKQRCREALRCAGFPQPACARYTSPTDARAFLRRHPKGPWIVKPAGAMGSLGVRRVDDPNSLLSAAADLARSHPDVLIEEFQPGREYSAEGLFVNGAPLVLALTEKWLVTNSFVEHGHVMPAQLDDALATVARQTVAEALTALGLRFGIFHVEFWLTGGTVALGEVHVRPGGDFIHWILELTTGLEPYRAVFDQLLGKPLRRQTAKVPAAAVAYLVPREGTVASVQGARAVAADPNCLRVELSVAVGQRMPALAQSSDRPGFVVASGETARHAWSEAQRLLRAVEIGITTNVETTA